MRRMYSEKELETIIHEVVGDYIEEGAFDESIAEAVDAYLTEHPVDITALEGLDISVGSLDADGLVTGAEIVEKMSGYSFTSDTPSADYTKEDIYVGVCKNGNKITFVIFTKIKATNTLSNERLGLFSIPNAVGVKLIPTQIGDYEYLDNRKLSIINEDENFADVILYIQKYSNTDIAFAIKGLSTLTLNKDYYIRIEVTFLLSNSLAS